MNILCPNFVCLITLTVSCSLLQCVYCTINYYVKSLDGKIFFNDFLRLWNWEKRVGRICLQSGWSCTRRPLRWLANCFRQITIFSEPWSKIVSKSPASRSDGAAVGCPVSLRILPEIAVSACCSEIQPSLFVHPAAGQLLLRCTHLTFTK